MKRPTIGILALGALLITSTAAADGFGPKTWISFDAAQEQLPESITADTEGNMYVSVSDSIQRIDSEGNVHPFATLPIAAFVLGVKVGPDGCVYAASTSLDPSVEGAFLWRACEPGTLAPFAELDHAGGPNDLAFLPSGDLLVTDPQLGVIYVVSPQGDAQIWLDDAVLVGDPTDPALVFSVQGVNGIAVGRFGRSVYVGNLDHGRIIRIAVRHDGTAGHLRVVAEDSRLRGADGIALDVLGNVYVSVNPQDALALVTPGGWIWPLAEGAPLDGPSSLVFGAARSDRHTLYITSSAFSRAFGFQDGAPMPAILTMPVLVPGLPLH